MTSHVGILALLALQCSTSALGHVVWKNLFTHASRYPVIDFHLTSTLPRIQAFAEVKKGSSQGSHNSAAQGSHVPAQVPTSQYVATVNYGPNSPSLLYVCTLTSLVPQSASKWPNTVVSPNGYTCTYGFSKPPVGATNPPPTGETQSPVEPVASVPPPPPPGVDLGSGLIDSNGNVIVNPTKSLPSFL